MTSLYTKCLRCKGTGWVYVQNPFIEGDVVPDHCFDCDGTGKERVEDENTLELIENAGAIK